MKKTKLFYSLCFLYSLLLLFFLAFPFKLLSYEEIQGEMVNEQEAILLSKNRITKRTGYIDNHLVMFQVQNSEKHDNYYLVTIRFMQKQPQALFTIYLKKNQQSIFKILIDEWRKEWKN